MKPKLGFSPPIPPQIDFKQVCNAQSILRDIPYGQEPRQQLDLYLPRTGSGPYPLVIYVHSGAFVGGSKSDVGILSILRALKEGMAVAAVEYRSAYQVTWPAQIFDLKSAIRLLRTRALEWNLDSERFALWGVSAGGYIASATSVTSSEPALDPDPSATVPCTVKAVVDWGGACGRLDWLDQEILDNGFGRATHGQENSPESIMMGAPLGDIPELCQLASPASHVRADVPYFLIQHGIQDGTVPIQQSRMFASAIAWHAGNARVIFTPYDVPSAHQGQWYETEEIIQEALLFLKKYL